MKKLLIFLALLISLQGFGQTVLTSGSTVLKVYDNQQPLNIETTCEVWLDGKDAGQFTLDGTYVDDWIGKGSLGVHVVNTNDNTTRPTYDSNTGRVTFIDGNSTFLQSAAFTSALTQPNTIFIVYKITGTLGTLEFVFEGLNAANRNTFYYQNTFRIRSDAELRDGANDNNDNIHTALFNGATSEYWINGISVVSGNAGADQLSGITLGSYYGIDNYFSDVEICEVIVYNADISDVDRDKITGYLADKWSITATTDFKGYVLRQD